MAVAKMKYLNVSGPGKALSETLSALANCGSFAPESDEAIHSALRYGKNRYGPLLAKARGLLQDLGYPQPPQEYTAPADKYTLEEVTAFLESCAVEVARCSARKTEIESELELQAHTESLLGHMTDLDVNIDDLFSVKTLKVRVGRLPKTSYVRLAYYADNAFNFTSYFNFIVYDSDGDYYWGMYFAPMENAKDIDDIFASLYFERVRVPDFVHGKPDEALNAIREREAQLREELAALLSPAGMVTEEELARIPDITVWLGMMNQLYEMRRYALVFNRTFYISGFVPQADYAQVEKLISAIPNVKIKEAEHNREMPVTPPVKLQNGWFSRPYQMYIEMYSLPGYNGIDPTGMVALIYSVLFGLMFADVGQGLVLGLFGYFYMYRKRQLAIGHILTRAAVFSCLFGLLFGSVFGLEHLMDPLWHAMGFAAKPFEVMGPESITPILLLSVFIGVFVVALAMVTNIFAKLRQRHLGEALTGPSGVAGLVFYLALVGLVADSMLLHTGIAGGPVYILCLVVLPLLVMYMREPLSSLLDEGKLHVESMSGLFISGFFEMFVNVLEYLSNTISFLRVGGFILAHAGMMVVVNTLAEMASGPAYVFVMVVGNIFVIALEGLLVNIQVLRLNYYELFSRFYEADGEAFQPLCFKPDTAEL